MSGSIDHSTTGCNATKNRKPIQRVVGTIKPHLNHWDWLIGAIIVMCVAAAGAVK
jgi:hypothetical protein